MPNVEITNVSSIKIQNKYPAVQVEGKNLGTGADFSTRVFKSKKDLVAKVENLNTGDKVNLWMFTNDKGYPELKDVQPYDPSADKQSSGGGSSGGNGGGDSKFRTPDEIKRTSAIGLAKDLLIASYGGKAFKLDAAFEALTQLAEDVLKYVEQADEAEVVSDPPDDLDPNDPSIPDPPSK
jgi:hypothetical protein